MRALVTIGVMGMVMLGATAARADEKFGIVTLQLRAEQGDAPTHLCVVSKAKGQRTRQRLSEVLLPEPATEGSTPPSGSWLVDPAAWGGAPHSTDRYLCSTKRTGDCRPRVELPPALRRSEELYVACTADNLLESDDSQGIRPLFVLLEHLEGSPPSIESVRLVGGVATVGVAADLERVIVTARSLGGYYLPHRVSERAETEGGDKAEGAATRKHVSLTLQSRCRLAQVTLPGTRLSALDRQRLSVKVHGMPFDVARCVEGEMEDTTVVQVRVPPAPLGVGSIEIELAATEAGKAAATFGATYNETWPQTPFPLTFKQVTFQWRRPKCIYPEASCPVATLETGTSCDATITEEGCSYLCPGQTTEDALDLKLPLTVHFDKEGPSQSWTDRLAQNGQLLTSYVDSDDIYVAADISRWETEDAGNRITGVELFTEDGGTIERGITGVKKLQLKVPGASCEPLRFRPVGDREYRDDIATIADGSIEFGNHERMARRLSVSILLAFGGGPAWSNISASDSPPIYFNAIGQFALQYRPRRRGWSRVGFEARVGLTLGRWGQLVERATVDDTTDPSEDTVATTNEQRYAQARLFVEPALVVAAHERFEVGAGFGLGNSFPIRDNDDLTQERIEFIWTPSLDGRFYVKRWLGLALQVRGVFGERAFGVREETAAGSTDSTTRARPSTARSLLTLFGTVFRF